MKKALITGITGQDGSYLAELLLDKGYEVHGTKRRTSSISTGRIDHIYENPQMAISRFKLHYGDLSDSLNITRLVSDIRPAEVETLLGDASLARKELGWEPKISAQQMCAEMSQEDLNSCIKSLR